MVDSPIPKKLRLIEINLNQTFDRSHEKNRSRFGFSGGRHDCCVVIDRLLVKIGGKYETIK